MFNPLRALMLKRTVLLFFGFGFALSGCQELSIVSPDQDFMGRDSMVIDPPRIDILDLIADAGKSMNMRVSSLDRASGAITLEAGLNTFEFLAIGKVKTSQLDITTTDSGKKLDIQVLVTGNFGTGGQAAADKLVNTFKTKLKERLSTQK